MSRLGEVRRWSLFLCNTAENTFLCNVRPDLSTRIHHCPQVVGSLLYMGFKLSFLEDFIFFLTLSQLFNIFSAFFPSSIIGIFFFFWSKQKKLQFLIQDSAEQSYQISAFLTDSILICCVPQSISPLVFQHSPRDFVVLDHDTTGSVLDQCYSVAKII